MGTKIQTLEQAQILGILLADQERYNDIIIEKTPVLWPDELEFEIGWKGFWMQWSAKNPTPPVLSLDEPQDKPSHFKRYFEEAYISKPINLTLPFGHGPDLKGLPKEKYQDRTAIRKRAVFK